MMEKKRMRDLRLILNFINFAKLLKLCCLGFCTGFKSRLAALVLDVILPVFPFRLDSAGTTHKYVRSRTLAGPRSRANFKFFFFLRHHFSTYSEWNGLQKWRSMSLSRTLMNERSNLLCLVKQNLSNFFRFFVS